MFWERIQLISSTMYLVDLYALLHFSKYLSAHPFHRSLLWSCSQRQKYHLRMKVKLAWRKSRMVFAHEKHQTQRLKNDMRQYPDVNEFCNSSVTLLFHRDSPLLFYSKPLLSRQSPFDNPHFPDLERSGKER